MRQPTGGLGTNFLAEGGPKSFGAASRETEPLRHVLSCLVSGASRCGPVAATHSAKRYRQAPWLVRAAIFRPPASGRGSWGTFRPGSADLVKRRASRPALLPIASRCDPRHPGAGCLSAAIRRFGCGHDQGEPVITSSLDFRPREQGRSLSRRPQATRPELSRITIMIPAGPRPDKVYRRRVTRILCITKVALHIGSTGDPRNYPHAISRHR
jgi:hypothetical protein